VIAFGAPRSACRAPAADSRSALVVGLGQRETRVGLHVELHGVGLPPCGDLRLILPARPRPRGTAAHMIRPLNFERRESGSSREAVEARPRRQLRRTRAVRTLAHAARRLARVGIFVSLVRESANQLPGRIENLERPPPSFSLGSFFQPVVEENATRRILPRTTARRAAETAAQPAGSNRCT